MAACDFEFHSVSPTALPGLHGKEAMFGQKRMSVQREQLAGKLSRSCRINEGRPSLLAATATSADTGDRTYRFRHRGAPAISHSVASRNEVVEKNSKAIQHFSSGDASPRGNKDRRLSEVTTHNKAPIVDSKALTAEIDSVALELRNLIAGVDTDHSLGAVVKSTEVRKDDDEEEGQSLHAKLLRYRFVRKIEAPPPPLEPLEGSYLKTAREVDKMDQNLQKFRIGWKRDALVRAQHWNQETYERTATARCRRAEDSERFENHLLRHMAMKEKVPERVEALRNAQVERLKAKAAAREEKLEQVRKRRFEEQEARHAQLKEMQSTDRRGKERTTTLQDTSQSLVLRPSQEDGTQSFEENNGPISTEDGVAATEGQEEGMDWFQQTIQTLREEDEEEEEEREKKKKDAPNGTSNQEAEE